MAKKLHTSYLILSKSPGTGIENASDKESSGCTATTVFPVTDCDLLSVKGLSLL